MALGFKSSPGKFPRTLFTAPDDVDGSDPVLVTLRLYLILGITVSWFI